MKSRRDPMLDLAMLLAVSLTFCVHPTLQQANQTNTTNNTTSSTISPFTNVVSTVKPTTQASSKACLWGRDVWRICWRNSPPYVFNNKNKSDVTGILIEVLTKGLGICGCSTKLNFTMANSYEDFLNCSKSDSIDIALPFPENKAALRTWLYTVVDSPNIYLLLNRKTVETEAKDRVLSEFFSVWTIAVLTVLLAIIFGIIVWFLDMKWNTEEFPASFVPGSLEGIWWSFVTLTTVGYGDKTPKFPVARILAVVWMFIGMAMISLLTATMTKALTTAVFDYQTYIQSKNRIGVLNHSYTFNEAVKKGLKIQVFPNLEEMYTTLDDPNNKKIGGILVDIFVATYVKNNRERFKLSNTLFMAKSFDVVYPLAFYLSRGVTRKMLSSPSLPYNHFSYCFSKTFLTTNQQINVYAIVDKYIQLRPSGSNNQESENGIKFEIDLFKQTEKTFLDGVKILSGVLGVLIILGFLWQIVYFRRSQSESFIRKSKGGDIESIDMTSRNHRANKKINVMMKKLHEVDKALNTLSEFREMLEQYKRESNRYDSGIVNGAAQNDPAGASINKGFSLKPNNM